MIKWIKSLFNKNQDELTHTCGSWPDSYWSKKDYEMKKIAQKDCLACKFN